MFKNLDVKQVGAYLGRAARMMVGMPDYGTYVEHMKATHPDKPYMTYEEFFKERINARYGSSTTSRCC